MLFVVRRRGRKSDICRYRCDSGSNQACLILCLANGPTAAPRADNLDLLQQRRLFPVNANTLDLVLIVEADDMDLEQAQKSASHMH